MYVLNQKCSPFRLPFTSLLKLLFIILIQQQQHLKAVVYSSACANSQNIGGTFEALPQKQWTSFLNFVFLLPGFHPPHY